MADGAQPLDDGTTPPAAAAVPGHGPGYIGVPVAPVASSSESGSDSSDGEQSSGDDSTGRPVRYVPPGGSTSDAEGGGTHSNADDAQPKGRRARRRKNVRGYCSSTALAVRKACPHLGNGAWEAIKFSPTTAIAAVATQLGIHSPEGNNGNIMIFLMAAAGVALIVSVATCGANKWNCADFFTCQRLGNRAIAAAMGLIAGLIKEDPIAGIALAVGMSALGRAVASGRGWEMPDCKGGGGEYRSLKQDKQGNQRYDGGPDGNAPT